MPDLNGVDDIGVYLLHISKQVQQAVFNVFAAVDAYKKLVFYPFPVYFIRLSPGFGLPAFAKATAGTVVTLFALAPTLKTNL